MSFALVIFGLFVVRLYDHIGKVVSSGSLHDITEPGIYWLTSSVTDKPESGAGAYVISRYSTEYLSGIYIVADTVKCYAIKYSSNAWAYELLAFRKSYNVTATTSGTGAIAIDNAYKSYTFVGGYLTTGDPGFVVRRDGSYFTVFNNDGTVKANTSVAFTAVFI